MITGILRSKEQLEIAIGLLTGEQTVEYERICKNIRSQRKLCGFLNMPAECEDKECALCSLDDAGKRAIDCPYVRD